MRWCAECDGREDSAKGGSLQKVVLCARKCRWCFLSVVYGLKEGPKSQRCYTRSVKGQKKSTSRSVKVPNKTRSRCDWWNASINENEKRHKTPFFASKCVSRRLSSKTEATSFKRDEAKTWRRKGGLLLSGYVSEAAHQSTQLTLESNTQSLKQPTQRDMMSQANSYQVHVCAST